MGGHGHGPPYKVPDYTIYKIENVPELKAFQEKLAKEGLKDPWLRNHVWRFKPRAERLKEYRNFALRGARVGIPAFLVTIAVEKFLGIDYHGHHDDHGHH